MNENKKLLIIDDEEAIVEWIKKLFERKGFITIGAVDGETGLELFKKENPDVTLIDIYMPDSSLNGIDVLKKIKEINNNAVCIMLTFMGGEDIIEECKKLGASNFIRKPIEIDALTKIIEEALKYSEEESRG